jgi:hypothetical protein
VAVSVTGYLALATLVLVVYGVTIVIASWFKR